MADKCSLHRSQTNRSILDASEHFQPPSESGGGGHLLFVAQVCRILLREGDALLVPGTVAKDEAVHVAARLLHELDVHVARLPPGPTVGGFT